MIELIEGDFPIPASPTTAIHIVEGSCHPFFTSILIELPTQRDPTHNIAAPI